MFSNHGAPFPFLFFLWRGWRTTSSWCFAWRGGGVSRSLLSLLVFVPLIHSVDFTTTSIPAPKTSTCSLACGVSSFWLLFCFGIYTAYRRTTALSKPPRVAGFKRATTAGAKHTSRHHGRAANKNSDETPSLMVHYKRPFGTTTMQKKNESKKHATPRGSPRPS